MTKSADAFRTISEVADWLNTPAHVLRFWESKFAQVKPVKRAGGRRYYRPTDMKLLGGIKRLLHDDGMTIKGVQKLLREQGMAHVAGLSQPLGDAADDVDMGDLVIDAQGQPVADTTADTVTERAVAPAEEPPASEPVESTETSETPKPALTPAPELPDSTLLETALNAAGEKTAAETETTPAEEEVATSSVATDQNAPDAAVMPSFRTRQLETAPETSEQSRTTDASPEPGLPAIQTPDLPDDPDDDIPAESGPLAALARLPRHISPQLAEELQRIASALRATGGRQ